GGAARDPVISVPHAPGCARGKESGTNPRSCARCRADARTPSPSDGSRDTMRGVPAIVLATLNAKWIHASFGLRCLRANLGEQRAASEILEFEITQRPADVVEAILRAEPAIVGLGVYVWNARQSLQVARML